MKSWVGALLLSTTLSAGAAGDTVLVEERFEAWPPPGWSIALVYQGVLWKSSADCDKGIPNRTGGEGFYADANSDCIGYSYFDSTLISPAFSLADPSITSARLEFRTALKRWVSWYATAEVLVTTDEGAHLTTLLKYPELNYDHRTETIDLTPYLGQPTVRIGFRYQTLEVDFYWQVDDVRVTATTGAVTRKAGDCDGDGTVSITELQQVVNNQLGITQTGCGDCDNSGSVSITELQKVVNCQLVMPNCDTACAH